MLRKNVASQFLGFVGVNATTGAAMTGTTGFAAYRVLDGGAQASATGTVTDKGNGQYSFALSQADTNGNDCSILFTMTGMVPVEKTFVTTACDPTITAFGLVLVKGTNITGFNDIAATAIVSSGAITTSSGAVSSVTTVATTTNLTNAPGAGDFTAAMKTSLNAATPAATVSGTVDANIVSVEAGLGTPLSDIADAVRDVNNTSPAADSLGADVKAGGTTGDPWATDLPGAYGAGTAGQILGDIVSGVVLTAAGLDAVSVETGVNARQALSPILAASAGVLIGATTGTIVIKAGANPGTTRVTATTDDSGNRTAVTLTLPT